MAFFFLLNDQTTIGRKLCKNYPPEPSVFEGGKPELRCKIA